MIADFLTKPLQGKAFDKFRDKLIGVVLMYQTLKYIFQFRFGTLLRITDAPQECVGWRCMGCLAGTENS